MGASRVMRSAHDGPGRLGHHLLFHPPRRDGIHWIPSQSSPVFAHYLLVGGRGQHHGGVVGLAFLVMALIVCWHRRTSLAYEKVRKALERKRRS